MAPRPALAAVALALVATTAVAALPSLARAPAPAPPASGLSSAFASLFSSPAARAASARAARKAAILAEIKEENDWKSDLVLGSLLTPATRAALPRVAVAWLRNYLACMAIYFGLGAVWCYYIYYVFGATLFKPGTIPGRAAVFEQIKVASVAMPLYAVLPSVVEAAAEKGYTAAVSRVSDLGGVPGYFVSFVTYMTFVEFGVYWMHRGLHDVKLGYRLLHHTHHKYNKEHTLSPFAGLAFNAIDGILQAIPYAVGLLFIPVHFFTHELLLFLTAVWTASIHDCLDMKMEPIMGAGYHTLHHTTYRHNYGHYFVYMDRAFGSLVTPAEYAAGKGKDKA